VIADHLVAGKDTVTNRVSSIVSRLGMCERTLAALFATNTGWRGVYASELRRQPSGHCFHWLTIQASNVSDPSTELPGT